MDGKQDHDYLDVGAPRLKSETGVGGFLGPMALFVVVLACAAGGWLWVSGAFSSPRAALASVAPAITDDDLIKRQLTAFVERFLADYYDYSYTQYDQAVAGAELMMTPAFQAAYNQRAEDFDFKRKLIELRVDTQAIKILPGSFAFLDEGDSYYVRLAGSMTYTTGSNGVSGDFPLELLLVARREGQSFLMDNVERLR